MSGANPFDGNDDALIGVVNDSGAAFSTPIFLSGSSSAGGIFDFDGDGICTFVTCNYSDPTTYEGPITSFPQTSGSSGYVDSTAPIAAGATTYFSLEGDPASLSSGTGGITSAVAAPQAPVPALQARAVALQAPRAFPSRRRSPSSARAC